MIISLYYANTEEQFSKVYINEKKDKFFLLIMDVKNKKIVSKIDSLFNDNDMNKLKDYLNKNKENILGYGIFEKRNKKTYIDKYGEIIVGYGNQNEEYEYIEKDSDILEDHFYKKIFICSLAYKCTDTNFNFENATISYKYTQSFIQIKN